MTDYAELKVTELKELLKRRGIPSTGLTRKQQICEALEKHDAQQSGRDGAEEPQAEEEVGESTEPVSTEAEVEAGQAAAAADIQRPGEGDAGKSGAPATDTVDERAGNEGDMRGGGVEGERNAEENAPATVKGEIRTIPISGPIEDVPPPDAIAPQPIVLENDAPVSREPSTLATPERNTPLAEPVSSDTRKRKRRSPTPPLSEETVNKKLKAAEGVPVTLPEDTIVEDAPPAAVESEVPEREEEIVDEKAEPVSMSDDSGDPAKAEDTTVEDDEAVAGTEPSTHSATRALYIRDLVRPLQPPQLRDHLVQLATAPDAAPDPSIITTFHLGAIRTHALVAFRSVSAAARARSLFHSRVWPDEPARKPVWVDFVPEEKVQRWIDAELSGDGGGNSRRDMRRWEVVYTTDDSEGGATATHREVTSSTSGTGLRQPSIGSGAGQGMPNAPLGPRASRPSVSSSLPPTEPDPAPRKPKSESFNILDHNFPSTTTKPKLYYKPVSEELVEKRMEELKEKTSRDWDDERGSRGGGSAVDRQLRRYTFEDGDRLVDGGPDIGRFGRGPEELGVVTGGRRRGRGGYYGGGGDSYRGRR